MVDPGPENQSDCELVERINKGDTEAFALLYRRYRDWVFRVARRFTGHHHDALDVMQETFAYLHGKFPGFKFRARLTTFLYPVVRNLSLAAGRKRKRSVAEEDDMEQLSAPEQRGGSDPSLLAAVLAVLPRAQREVLLMRFVDDMSLGEIAEAMRVSEGTVKSRLYRALQTLRQDNRTKRYFE